MVQSGTAVFFIALTIFGTYGFDLSDHCTVTANASPNNVMRVTANSSCTEGSIWWDLPRGILKVTFDPIRLDDFTLCVHLSMGPPCIHVYQITPTGPVDITAVSQETDMCVTSINGHVIIQMSAPTMVPYMTLYSYKMHA